MPEPVDPSAETVSGRHLPETGRRPSPPALEADTPRLVLVGLAIWAAFLVVGAVRGDSGWVWTCVAGIALGSAGLVLARRAARRAR